MAEESTVFLCRSCKPVINIDKPSARPSTVEAYSCKACDFKTSFKYNLKRHIEKQHGGNDLPEVQTEQEQETEENLEKEVHEETMKETTMEELLNELDLGSLLTCFVSEGVDLAMLKLMDNVDVKECLKEIGIKRFGDRHKIAERILIEKRKENLPKQKRKSPKKTNSKEHVDMQEDLGHTQQSVPELLECSLCAEALRQVQPQHRCRKCDKVVCNLFCSISDPNSENEMHRIHKPGDVRCISETFEASFSEGIKFTCPNCDEEFASNTQLDVHVKEFHEPFESTFPTMSLASDGSLSDIQEECKQCGKLFENELDLANHVERVHEYGEIFEIYPCEECGFRGTDLREIKSHIEDEHGANKSESSSLHCSLEEIGIFRLPEITERRKQNFEGLNIDADGDIEVDDDSDHDYDSKQEDELLLLEEDDWNPAEPLISTRSRRAKKQTVSLDDAIKTSNKRKVDEEIQITKKKQKKDDNLLECSACNSTFTRKDNLARHIRNKH